MKVLSLAVACLIASFLLIQCNGQDVVGCGGFVESPIPIKFEQVEIKLYTKQGAFKSKTECAPKNGYFLVAIYDKGEYVLKISPPEGWGFKPQEIELNIDGNDPCSKGEDLNFKFSGFTVSGNVLSLGKETGPSGVNVHLKNSEGKVISETTTSDSGSYTFPDIMPGNYISEASHPTWTLTNNRIQLNVLEDNVKIESILVSGYDVKGHVLSSGEPIQDVVFILFSNEKKSVKNCQEVPKEYLAANKIDQNEIPLCSVKSQADGSFVFPSVPSGSYNLVPFYTAQNIVFDIVPGKLAFSVNLKSVMMKTPFQVYGFSVKGKVIDTIKSGIGGVEIVVTNDAGESRTALTSDNGEYMLENITTGHYTFKLSKENYIFEESKTHISPNVPTLKDIVANEYKICGSIVIKQMPPGVRQLSQLKVLLQPVDQKDGKPKSTAVTKNGHFCFQSTPGKFRVEIPIIESEAKAGLRLRPTHVDVHLVNKPLTDIKFEQFLATVFGDIHCIKECSDVSVYLMPSESSSALKLPGTVEGAGSKLSFSIPDVLPGKYKLIPKRKNWCWEDQQQTIEINDQDIRNVQLKHSGYHLKCSISHNISLNFALEGEKEQLGSFELKKGNNQFCLKTPGTYVLKPVSCYRFEHDEYIYKTEEPQTLSLKVAFYKTDYTIRTTKNVTDLALQIKSQSSGQIETKTPVYQGAEERFSVYKIQTWGKLSEELELTPQSKEVLFTPPSLVTTISESCPGATADFEGHEGIFIQGDITPPFADVSVTIKILQGTGDEKQVERTIEVMTDAKGAYRVGPMHGGTQYEVSAVKDGYHITPVANKKGSFIAQKLGHISVLVLDERGKGMENVLLSLSGRQYRNNNLTNKDGTFLFSNLGPGEYFLRPMQKEYSFEASSQTISVTEGQDIVINIKGKRVAFSCSGSVTSLAGVPEEKIAIEAVGLHKCSEYHESTISDANGDFRIRGLQPGCSYNVRLMRNEANEGVERLAPDNHVIQVQQEDVTGVHFLAFMKPTKFVLTAHLDTEDKLLSTIKVLLYEEDDLDSPVHSISPGVVKFIQFPALKPKTYIIKVQSTLSGRSHDIVTSSATIKPDADLGKKHVNLKFEAKEKNVDLEPTQSVITLPLAVALLFLAYNYDSVITFLTKVNIFLQTLSGNKQEGVDGVEETPEDYFQPAHTGGRLTKRKKR
ncbi:BOS complex subunit NOMO1-like [Clytia hemisphaerica]|uniref:Nodal modulator 1 n=1 Tax=Clytia hemisphaerica TaxID=252671 RepID=A0A7M5V287_9CNID